MTTLATLTMNPALDLSYEVERVVDTHKMRATAERYGPGGGGINVARVFVRLGGDARSVFPAGGPVGEALHRLVDLHQLACTRIPIAGNSRASTTAIETSTGREYRFVPEGPELDEDEWLACIEAIRHTRCQMLVASGSLPRGVPDDFYARVGDIARDMGARFALDTSGRALAPVLAAGGIDLFKPSLGELSQLVGRPLDSIDEIDTAARSLIERGSARIVAVTMGHRGGLLAHEGGTLYVPAIHVTARSAVGAGDSFLAAMLFKRMNGADAETAFRYGMAAGAAAVCTPGTDLCSPPDIDRLLTQQLEGVRR